MQDDEVKTVTEIASEGGNARARALSEDRRREIARLGAASRWEKAGRPEIPRALKEAPLKIGNIEFECAVLTDETRVISERAFSRAIGAKRAGSHWVRRKHDPTGAYLPVFLSAKNLRPFISIELTSALSEPTVYVASGGQRAYGIKAQLIPQILDVWLKARDAGKLTASQLPFSKVAEILMRGLAATGIIALIDEATGFQDLRARDYLAKILEAYIVQEIRQWVRTFPASFFKEICRLKNIKFRADMKLPRYFGHYINDLVYSRLAPGVLADLKKKNPVVEETGRRKHKHTQWLTEDFGHPKLLHHLGLLEGLARGHADGDYKGFKKQVDRALPPHMPMPLFEQDQE